MCGITGILCFIRYSVTDRAGSMGMCVMMEPGDISPIFLDILFQPNHANVLEPLTRMSDSKVTCNTKSKHQHATTNVHNPVTIKFTMKHY